MNRFLYMNYVDWGLNLCAICCWRSGFNHARKEWFQLCRDRPRVHAWSHARWRCMQACIYSACVLCRLQAIDAELQCMLDRPWTKRGPSHPQACKRQSRHAWPLIGSSSLIVTWSVINRAARSCRPGSCASSSSATTLQVRPSHLHLPSSLALYVLKCNKTPLMGHVMMMTHLVMQVGSFSARPPKNSLWWGCTP